MTEKERGMTRYGGKKGEYIPREILLEDGKPRGRGGKDPPMVGRKLSPEGIVSNGG